MKAFLLLIIFFSIFNSASARIEVHQFESPQQEQRYKHLINELRCLVCQNQNLADSNAELAQDLRKQVYKMIMQGKSDKSIQDYMVTRYGDFVLYRPPFKTRTALLWMGPFIILGAGLILLLVFIRNRNKNIVVEISDSDRQKIKQILDTNNTGDEK